MSGITYKDEVNPIKLRYFRRIEESLKKGLESGDLCLKQSGVRNRAKGRCIGVYDDDGVYLSMIGLVDVYNQRYTTNIEKSDILEILRYAEVININNQIESKYISCEKKSCIALSARYGKNILNVAGINK